MSESEAEIDEKKAPPRELVEAFQNRLRAAVNNEVDFEVMEPVITALVTGDWQNSRIVGMNNAFQLIAAFNDQLRRDSLVVEPLAMAATIAKCQDSEVSLFLWKSVEDRIFDNAHELPYVLEMIMSVSRWIEFQAKPASVICREFSGRIQSRSKADSATRSFELGAAMEILLGRFDGANVRFLVTGRLR